MTKKITIILMFILPICSFGQTSKKASELNQISKKSNQTFEEYCLVNAVSYVTIVAEKVKSFKVSGELQSLENSKKSSYIDYGVELKENETQYFKLIGSEKILAIQSLNALRLTYSNTKK